MDEDRKYAYRWLLYQATLETRPLRYLTHRKWDLLNPFYWHERLRWIQRVGILADWLHNLAQFSCWDFWAFDEQRFWQEYERLRQRYPDCPLSNYKQIFETRLYEGRPGKPKAPVSEAPADPA